MAGPLTGVRILDLSMYIAGPYGPGLLADMGADVVKVEPLTADPLRNGVAGFLTWNRGKRGIAVDLRLPAGREVVHRLATGADVVVENYRPDVAERLGVDYKTLAALNPRLVYCTVTAYGSTGPNRRRPGVDPILQAESGVMRAQGGDTAPPVFLRIAVCDYYGAMLNATGILMALFHRARTGRGQRLETSLLQAGIFANSDAFVAYEGKPPRQQADPQHYGFGALDRLYQTEDSWLFLQVCTDAQWRALADALGLSEDPRFATRVSRQQHDSELGQTLADRFAGGPTERWLAFLETRGVPCAPVALDYHQAFFDDPHPLETGMVAEREHPTYQRVQQSANLVRFSEGGGPAPLAGPTVGQHTDEVLKELGYSAEQIAELRQAKVVA
ncbi:MAG: CoA transferase [Chloroflexi bacterium]|nr:CoA transferase [Chloroflexota bacterium]